MIIKKFYVMHICDNFNILQIYSRRIIMPLCYLNRSITNKDNMLMFNVRMKFFYGVFLKVFPNVFEFLLRLPFQIELILQ